MRALLVLIAGAALSAPVAAQKVKYQYDKLTDTTTASSPTIHYSDNNVGHMFAAMATDNGRPDLDVRAAALFAGQTQHADSISTVLLEFTITSLHNDVQTSAHEDTKAPVTAAVRLLLDDSTRLAFDANLADADSRFHGLADPKANTFVYIAAIPVATFDQIVSARRLEGSLYTSRFDFKEKDLGKLGAIRSVYGPAAP